MTSGDNNLSRTMKFELKPLESDFINLDTLPSGASIYYGSRYMGTTPLDIPKYSFAQKLTISLDGYLDKSLIIDQKSISRTIKLKAGVVDKESNYILKKNRFYRNTAIFSFSLAIPLFLGTQGDNINSSVYNISIGNAFFWGINLFIDLFRYLKAAELSVE
ncbi:PEGA domain-containing protein [Thiospirochaeta perfilievii]|uniref:PEGA domain-containing protein n=1 Tax=Thiospirochaeta perfilievii TaxID=252967 RepID=A0A5C1Q714_9SPIO|nr:PEGA domain-containing protein [Thiospirochaeta perfilievii]QEN03795.1 PEGA domain-containing protein [Thiospirochaeta perfilievii]